MVIFLESKKYIKSITFVQNIANQRYERLSGLPKHGDTDSAEFYLVSLPFTLSFLTAIYRKKRGMRFLIHIYELIFTGYSINSLIL